MKKKNILMVLAMLIVSVAYSQSVYYYTNGEKRYLRLEDNRRFVLVKTSDTTAFKRNCSIKMGDWREATGEQLEELRRIAEKKSGRSSVMARGVLCFFFDECDGEDCLSSNTKSKGTESAPLRPCLVNGKEYSILNRIPCELKGENADMRRATSRFTVYSSQITDHSVICNSTGQWSLPKISLWMDATSICGAMREEQMK